MLTSSVSMLAQMTSCAMRYDVIYHPSPINSHYLNTSGVDSPAFVKWRIKSYTNSPFSSCWANESSDLYQSKAWCTTIHANMSFINLRLKETFFSSSFFLILKDEDQERFDKELEGNWKSEKDLIVEHGRTGYCTGSESCPDAIVSLKLQFWRQGTGHVTSWRSRLSRNGGGHPGP